MKKLALLPLLLLLAGCWLSTSPDISVYRPDGDDGEQWRITGDMKMHDSGEQFAISINEERVIGFTDEKGSYQGKTVKQDCKRVHNLLGDVIQHTCDIYVDNEKATRLHFNL